MKEARCKGNVVYNSIYVTCLGEVKSTETESRLVVARSYREEKTGVAVS